MKTFIVLLLSCAAVFGAETLVPLKSGESEHSLVSYGLFCLVTDSRGASNVPPGADLILTLRNIGAKFIDMNGVTVTNFSLRDANKKKMKIYLGTHPNGMGYGDANIFHLTVDGVKDAPQPWTLHFDSGPKTFVPVELTITDIKPRKS